jgi:hypothetical protein
MQRKGLTILLFLALPACGASGGTPANQAANASVPEAAGPPANPALGHWVADSEGCDDVQDVEFTAADLRSDVKGPKPMVIPVTYSDQTADRVVLTTADGSEKRVILTRVDPDHLMLTTPDGKKTCRLARH